MTNLSIKDILDSIYYTLAMENKVKYDFYVDFHAPSNYIRMWDKGNYVTLDPVRIQRNMHKVGGCHLVYRYIQDKVWELLHPI